MKKLISLLASASLLCTVVPASAMAVMMPTITTDKTVITNKSDDYDPGSPVILSAEYAADEAATEYAGEPENSLNTKNTAEPLPFISDTLEVYEAPVENQVYIVNDTGKAEINISGKYIKPTLVPVNDIQLDYRSGNIYLKSPTELTGKKLVAASYEETDYVPEERTDLRILGVKVFDINTELIYPIEGNDSYCYYSDVFDISDFSYTKVRVMVLESLENLKPLTAAEDVYVVWSGALIPELSVRLLKKAEDGYGYSPVIGQRNSFDDNGVFSESCELEPGEYLVDIGTWSDKYKSHFTVRTSE
ncbi:MAG: hypothetical protein Q4G33_05855 [bacterium]|nr:hypothetical protein [bacterium]